MRPGQEGESRLAGAMSYGVSTGVQGSWHAIETMPSGIASSTDTHGPLSDGVTALTFSSDRAPM